MIRVFDVTKKVRRKLCNNTQMNQRCNELIYAAA